MKFIPNLLTLLNLFCGFAAITFVFAGKMEISAAFMGLSLLFDFFDGFFARILNATSKIGIELDSLSDVISFGVLPSTFIYVNLLLPASEFGLKDPFPLAIPAAIFACAAAYRLAKFNVEDSGNDYFNGLPTPAAAIFIVSLHFFLVETNVVNYWIWIIALTLMSFLMVSRIPLLSFKRLLKSKSGMAFSVISLLILVFLMSVFGFWTSFVFVPAYIIASVIYFFVLKKK